MRFTLENRITTLMVISSIFFISAFTFIQLNNQINNINRYNSYQANLSLVIVKNNLEALIRKAGNTDPSSYIQSSLATFKKSTVFKDALVFDKEGKIIASTRDSFIGGEVGSSELSKWRELEYAAKEDKWSVPEIDRFARLLNMYLTLKPAAQEPLAYIAKITFSLGNIQEALTEVYRPVIVSVIIVILLNMLFGYLLSKTVLGPIKILNDVTKLIASGNLSVRTDIRTKDELQELGETFNYMTVELIKMKERAENANPLTKLPGNIVIHEQVEQRIQENRKFVVIYCDLDNFKAFNDKYGIAEGDMAIKLSADLFKESIKIKGNADDFIGHEGGDDFILLTTPDKSQEIAGYITKEFNSRIRNLYSKEDLAQGYIVAHARDGSVKQFPIMSISLAGVTNEFRTISSYAEVTNIAADLKKKAKDIGGSVFVMDKRGT